MRFDTACDLKDKILREKNIRPADVTVMRSMKDQRLWMVEIMLPEFKMLLIEKEHEYEIWKKSLPEKSE